MATIRFPAGTVLARALLFAAAFAGISQPVFPQDQGAARSEASAENAPDLSVRHVAGGALIRAEVRNRLDWSRVPKGKVVEAKLSFPLFAGKKVALPAGTPLRVTVGSSERVRDELGFWRKTGRVIVRAFNPLEKSSAPRYSVTLNSAELLLPSGEWRAVQASVVRAGSAVIVGPQRARSASTPGETLALERAPRSKNKPTQTMLLQLGEEIAFPPVPDATGPPPGAVGRRARAYLLTRLSASESREGDRFQAQLAEPVRLGDRVFEPGSWLEGTVVRRIPPRILSRAGKLHLSVDQITAQDGETLDVSGTLSNAEADAQARFFLDEEGTLRGQKPGITNGLVDLAMSYALGKVSDDLAETPIRALAVSMSDAAVANAARYVGLAGAVTFLVTHHGRDVQLPKYAEIEIDFERVHQAATPSAASR
jgi:hypothetical protein